MAQEPANPSQRSFVQLDDSVVEILASNQLTRADHRLFWHLFLLDRWGDRFVELPSQSELALQLGLRRETINQSQAKLQSLGLFDFKVSKWKARNLAAPRSNATPEKSNTVLEKSNSELEKTNSELEKTNSDIYIDRACDQTIQTNTDFKKTFSEEEAPPPVEILEVEIVQEEEEESQPTPAGFVEAEDGVYRVNEAIALNDQHTMPRDGTSRIEKLQEIEKLSAKPQEFPWKETDGVTFCKEMMDAVYEANRGWYSLPSGAKNETAITARLKKLEKTLNRLDDSAIAAWNTLQSYWKSALSLIPRVQQVKEAFEDKEREEARARRRNSTIKFTA